MHIAFDIETALSNRTGMGRFTRELLNELPNYSNGNEYWLFHSGNYSSDNSTVSELEASGHRVFRLPKSRRALRLFGLIGRLPPLYRDPFPSVPDLLFSPTGCMLRIKAKKKIGMIHDLSVFEYPEGISLTEQMITRREFNGVVERCEAIGTVSEFSRGRIIERWGLTEASVVNVSSGANWPGHETEKSYSVHPELVDADGALIPYFIWGGSMSKRKNVPLIVRAFSDLISNHDVKAKLVLAGTPGNDSAHVSRLISTLGIGARVVNLGYVEEEQFREAIGGSLAFIFPSFYEGFGLPIIEAMSQGVPAVTTRLTATAEIGRQGALFVDANDETELARTMLRLIQNEGERAQIGRDGIDISKKYQWKETARRVYHLIDSVLDQ